MWKCTGMRSTKALARNAPGSAMIPISSAKADDLRGDHAGQPEHGNLHHADDDRDRRIGGDDRGAFEPRRHQQRQHDHARARGAADHHAIADRAERITAIADLDAVIFQQPPQRHAEDQHRTDHQRGAGAGQFGVTPGAEHAGRHRRGKPDAGAPPVDIFQERRHAARIGKQRRDRDDRHHRLGADQRHQDQRHQGAGAVARHAAEHGRQQRHARDQRELPKRDVGEAGKNRHGAQL